MVFIEYFIDNPNLTRENRRDIIKEINLIGGVKVLPLLTKADICRNMIYKMGISLGESLIPFKIIRLIRAY